jgi:uncharacterized protein (DUF433 family)
MVGLVGRFIEKVRGMSASRRDKPVGSSGIHLGSGLYSLSDCTRIIRQRIRRQYDDSKFSVNARKVGRWAHGRHESAMDYAAYLSDVEKVGKDSILTFAQLIELLMIASFRAAGLSYPAIREAHGNAEKKWGHNPFARPGFRSDGKRIFTEVGDPDPEELNRRQLFFEDFLEPILFDVSYLDELANRLSPLGEDRTVILDSNVAFGAPVDKSSGVRTAVLYAMKVNDPIESNESIADWYGVTPEAVQDAVDYEEGLLAA